MHNTLKSISTYDAPQLLPAVFDASKQCELNAEWQPLWRACYLYRDLLVLKNRSITTVAAISAAPSQVGGDTLPFWISMNEVCYMLHLE